MNTIEKFYICNLSKQNQHLNDNYAIARNPIIDAFITQKLKKKKLKL
jgi:hypothetical protein